MNLVFHHLRKDARQFRLALTIWAAVLALDLAANLGWIFRIRWTSADFREPFPAMMLDVLVLLLWALLIKLPLVAVLAESPAKTDAFLSTRPLPKRDLVLAKTLFVFLFVILPATLQECLHLALQGLPAEIVLRGGGERLFLVVPVATLAAVVGALWRNWREFVTAFVAVGAGVWLVLALALFALESSGTMRRYTADFTVFQVLAQLYWLCPVLALLAWWNYRARWRVVWRGIVVGAVVLASFVVGAFAPRHWVRIQPEESAKELAALAMDRLDIRPRQISASGNRRTESGPLERVGFGARLSLPSETDATSIDWIPRRAELHWTAKGQVVPSLWLRAWDFGRVTRNFLAADDVRALAGLLPTGTMMFGSTHLPFEREHVMLGEFALSVAGQDTESPVFLDSRIEGHVFRWQQETELPISPGATTQDRAGSWRVEAVGSPPGRQPGLDLLLSRRQIALFTSSDPLTAQAESWPNHLYAFGLYDPTRRIGRVGGYFYFPQVRVATHTSYPLRVSLLHFDDLSTVTPLTPKARESAKLLIFRRHYLGTIKKEWTSPPFTLADFLHLNAVHPNTSDRRSQGDALSAAEFHRRLKALAPPPPDSPRPVVGTYVNEVLRLVEARRLHVLDDDPVARQLAAYVPKHLDMFFEAMPLAGLYPGIALNAAVRRGVSDEQKPQIIAALARRPDLAQIVLDRGWLEEAKEPLLKLLDSPQPLGSAALAALAWYEDPRTYPGLLEILENDPNLENYERLRGLPGIQAALDRAVDRAWRARPRTLIPGRETPLVLSVALRHGRREALQEAFGILRVLRTDRSESLSWQLLEAFRANLVCAPLKPQETYDPKRFVPWLLEHKAEEFRFDAVRRRWVPTKQG
ncbi:MAG: hypothetical protein HZA90_22310 [Verrucomicrobia bacterium]|nr:hypothetical protein [Verrucomicrobiota bacterium]